MNLAPDAVLEMSSQVQRLPFGAAHFQDLIHKENARAGKARAK